MAEEGCGQGEGTSSQPGPLMDNKASSNASVTRESPRIGGLPAGPAEAGSSQLVSLLP